MFKKKCPGCGKEIDKKFNFCPWCGISLKKHKEEEDFGMLGKSDDIDFESQLKRELDLPPGLNKIMNSLIKQLEKQIAENWDSQMPKGFTVSISTGEPKIRKVTPTDNMFEEGTKISKKELERRRKLERVEATSSVRRLADRVIYEVEVPGVKSKKDIVITKVEDGFEIKAYSKDKCYYKVIPLKVEIINWYLKNEKLFIELKD